MFAFWIISPCCRRAEDPDMFLRQEMTRLEQMTVPPDAQILISYCPDREAPAETAHWEFKTEWKSEQYLQWVTPRLSDSFRDLRATESQLTFSRYLDGDMETVKVEAVSEGPRLHVRISLEVYPD